MKPHQCASEHTEHNGNIQHFSYDFTLENQTCSRPRAALPATARRVQGGDQAWGPPARVLSRERKRAQAGSAAALGGSPLPRLHARTPRQAARVLTPPPCVRTYAGAGTDARPRRPKPALPRASPLPPPTTRVALGLLFLLPSARLPPSRRRCHLAVAHSVALRCHSFLTRGPQAVPAILQRCTVGSGKAPDTEPRRQHQGEDAALRRGPASSPRCSGCSLDARGKPAASRSIDKALGNRTKRPEDSRRELTSVSERYLLHPGQGSAGWKKRQPPVRGPPLPESSGQKDWDVSTGVLVS
ncbi:serine/arginine repetitive matrix protein 1-like [Felis catus]|uniref:serine/arginine repetitive matrix protein 1-like n=1 Tax=Felis catus TaxID=9685 RepID=UPI001D19BAF5|nr:serine/arginine repetitive matrix protein 1-like [Felis catus]